MAESLADQLKQHVKTSGSISSADVATFEAPPKTTGPTTGPVAVTIDKAEFKKDEPLSAEVHKPTEALTAAPDKEIIQIIESERMAFLDCLVRNNRFTLPFNICGGRIQGVLRARKQGETQGIIQQLRREMDAGRIKTDTDYSVRHRSMLLATQVESLNDMDFPELVKPWVRQSVPAVMKADGVTVDTPEKMLEPGWLGQVEYWLNQDDALVTMVYEELQKFEQKYWTMVRNSGDQNFWHPAASS